MNRSAFDSAFLCSVVQLQPWISRKKQMSTFVYHEHLSLKKRWPTLRGGGFYLYLHPKEEKGRDRKEEKGRKRNKSSKEGLVRYSHSHLQGS